MSFESWILLLLLFFLGTFVFVVWAFWWIRRRIIRLGKEFIGSISEHILLRVKKMSHEQQIVEYDKILDRTLKEL